MSKRFLVEVITYFMLMMHVMLYSLHIIGSTSRVFDHSQERARVVKDQELTLEPQNPTVHQR
jgi:hypothetical protein